jgi:hypothetical protein
LQQTVDTETDPTRRRHPVLQRAEEILVQAHRLDIAGRGLAGLLDEPFPLLQRVVELGIAGAELDAADVEVPLLRCRRTSGEVSSG